MVRGQGTLKGCGPTGRFCKEVGQAGKKGMKVQQRLFSQLRETRIGFSLAVGLSAVAGILVIAQAYCLSILIDAVFLQHQTLAQVAWFLAILLLVITVRAFFLLGGDVAASRVARQIRTRLREGLVSHLFALGPHMMKGERSGEVLNTVIEGTEALDAYFSQYVPQMFLTVLVPLAILLAVFPVDLLSGVILLLTAPILPFFMALIGIKTQEFTRKRWSMLGLMSAHFLDVLQGITTLKVLGRSKVQRETIRTISDRYRHATMEVLRMAFLSSLVLEMGATISTALIAVEVGLRLLYGHMAFQPALFVLLLAPEFYLPLRTLGTRHHAGMAGSAAAERVFTLLDTPAQQASSQTVRSQPVSVSSPLLVSFEDVQYAYGEQRSALKGVSFQIRPHQIVALVGPSGAGKSTLASLLLRFLDPASGAIYVNGKSLSTIPAQEWRKYVSWVPQHPYLFNATIAENIRLGCTDATLPQVIEVAKQAHAHEFIQTLPQGYQTIIGERGARLSGGQAQLIGLARAFLKNAPLLILDEPASHLDPEHEQLIWEATMRLVRERSVLMIAHRLSTVYRADSIVVLDQGRVVAEGTHSYLASHSDFYRQLVNVAHKEGEVAE
jgi:ATP-binding cassette subfamily C protein CydD